MQYSDLKPMIFDWSSTKNQTVYQKVIELTSKALLFYDLANWSVDFDKAKKRAGCCSFIEQKISLSKHFVKLNSIKEIEATIKHEIAHAIAYIHFGHSGHGRIWKKVAIAIGDDGKRCYDSTKVVMPTGKYIFECSSCHKEVHYHKKPRVTRACGKCCREFNNGRFNIDFLLIPKINPQNDPQISVFTEVEITSKTLINS